MIAGLIISVLILGFAVGRLTAPDKVVTIIHEPQFDLLPSNVVEFRRKA